MKTFSFWLIGSNKWSSTRADEILLWKFSQGFFQRQWRGQKIYKTKIIGANRWPTARADVILKFQNENEISFREKTWKNLQDKNYRLDPLWVIIYLLCQSYTKIDFLLLFSFCVKSPTGLLPGIVERVNAILRLEPMKFYFENFHKVFLNFISSASLTCENFKNSEVLLPE